jgi:hypothetical protein
MGVLKSFEDLENHQRIHSKYYSLKYLSRDTVPLRILQW